MGLREIIEQEIVSAMRTRGTNEAAKFAAERIMNMIATPSKITAIALGNGRELRLHSNEMWGIYVVRSKEDAGTFLRFLDSFENSYVVKALEAASTFVPQHAQVGYITPSALKHLQTGPGSVMAVISRNQGNGIDVPVYVNK